jgi:hypothetical protein
LSRQSTTTAAITKATDVNQGRTNVPKAKMLKIGIAGAAASVGAVLAITSVFAHTPPSTNGHSVVGNLVKAARAASFPLVANDPALNVFANEQIADAEEAAERAAALAALQQKLAAELAAKKAAAAAADPCVAADQAEDAAERAARKAADQAEDAAEAASGVEDPAEDAKEKAARQAADKAEDASEAPCAAAEVKAFTKTSSGEHHSHSERRRD